MNRRRFFWLLAFCIAWLPAVAGGQIEMEQVGDTAVDNIVLTASQDAFIASNLPNERMGVTSPTVLGLGHRPDNGAQRVLLQFNLNSVPAGAVIVEAELVLFTAVGMPSQDPPMGVEIRPLRGPWSEQLVTWGNSPDRGNVLGNGQILVVKDAQNSIDITALTQEWVSGELDNHGLVITGDENPAQTRVRNFYSKEDNMAPSGFYPRLFITYNEDATPPTMTMNPLPETASDPFMVSWMGEDDENGTGIDFYQIEYRQNFGEWQLWLEETEATSALFDIGVSGSYYDFRGRATDRAGNVSQNSKEVRILYGVRPPVSAMNPLPAIMTESSFIVSWREVDTGGGPPLRYRLHFRFNNGPWEVWQDNLTQTSITIFPNRGDGFYSYSVQAINSFNVEEPFKDWAQASTAVDRVAPFLEPQAVLPIVLRK